MSGLKASLFRRPPMPSSRKDREGLDFCRFPSGVPLPVNGIRYIALLEVCMQVTGREIRDLRELNKSEIRKVKERMREKWNQKV